MSSKNAPTVSVICTVYNKGKWLNQAIESFLRQKNVVLEIILIDDASTDHSRDIIQKFSQDYPDKIVALYNDCNLGIARTWLKACLVARGKYIARCDGDDYWIDDYKLEKQLHFLQEHPDSRWCGTDINFVDEDGNITKEHVFTHHIITLSDSYEKMMATRGFTAPSTWLIERELMLRANEKLKADIDTADDTFNLQLDLFNDTQFSFLPEVTVAYRVNQNSDSRPTSKDALDKRFDKLLETQLAYLEKYPNANYQEMIRMLLKRCNDFEKVLSQWHVAHSQVSSQKVRIYYATLEEAFSQEKSLEFQLQYHDTISFDLPNDTTRLRIDLSKLPSFYQRVTLSTDDYHTELLPSFSNGSTVGNYIMFNTYDSQLIYDVSMLDKKSLTLEYTMFNVDDINREDYVAKILFEELVDAHKHMKKLDQLNQEQMKKSNQVNQYKKQLEELTVAYNSVIHSRRWTIPSAIINLFRRKK